MILVPELQQFPSGRPRLVGHWRENHKVVVRNLWRKVRQEDVQTGDGIEQAMVFKAHAVPQGLCENLTNALKWLANQQEDGDGLLQNIVTNLCKGSRGPSIRPHGELLLLLMQKKPTFVPDSEAFNSYNGSEASKDEQTDSVSENNVGNGALFVICLHRSGDEVANLASSCHIALDVLCQELHDVERRRGWFGF